MGATLICLDANVVIRLVEGDAVTRAPLVARLAASLGVAGSLMTSRLTRLECRSKPLRAGDLATLAQFDLFFNGIELILADVSSAAIERATRFRAQYGLKTPDALLYATAVEAGAAGRAQAAASTRSCSAGGRFPVNPTSSARIAQ